MVSIHASQPGAYTHTLRVTFAYDGPQLDLIRVQRVEMRAPAPATPPPPANQAGYWLEVRDGNGALIYHRPLHDPLRRHIESFGDPSGAPMRRHPAIVTKGEFEVLVPDLPGAQTFRLHGPSTEAVEARAAFAPSISLSEHSFDDLHRLASRGTGEERAP